MSDDGQTVVMLGVFEVEGRRVSAVTRPGSATVWLDVIHAGEAVSELGTVERVDTGQPTFYPARRHRVWAGDGEVCEQIKSCARRLYVDRQDCGQ